MNLTKLEQAVKLQRCNLTSFTRTLNEGGGGYVVELTIDEFNLNIRDIENSEDKKRYCYECANWININKFKCIYCNHSWSLRSERIIEPECKICDGLVVKIGQT